MWMELAIQKGELSLLLLTLQDQILYGEQSHVGYGGGVEKNMGDW